MGETMDKLKGNAKQAAGNATGDRSMENEGKVDEAKGNVKGAVDSVGDAVKDKLHH